MPQNAYFETDKIKMMREPSPPLLAKEGEMSLKKGRLSQETPLECPVNRAE
jgi:hypothetical protein